MIKGRENEESYEWKVKRQRSHLSFSTFHFYLSTFHSYSVNLNLRDRSWVRHSRESGNPGRLTYGCCLQFLDARLRGHDGHEPIKIKLTDHSSSLTTFHSSCYSARQYMTRRRNRYGDQTRLGRTLLRRL
jgi:hypothetical protein